MNYTVLMAAVATGNVALVDALIERGANLDSHDHLGRNALHIALREAFHDARFARGPLAAILERIAPPYIDVQSGARLHRIDRRLSEYWVFQTLSVLFKDTFAAPGHEQPAGINTEALLRAWEALPASVVKPERNKRAHVSSVLSRNEVAREYAYNRQLFKRIEHGWYQINPELKIRRRQGEESWQPVLEALNLPLVHELAHPDQWGLSQQLWQSAGGGELPTPVAAESWEARRRAEYERAMAALREAEARRQAQEAAQRSPPPSEPPRWGTPEAKRAAREDVQRRIDAQRKAGGSDEA